MWPCTWEKNAGQQKQANVGCASGLVACAGCHRWGLPLGLGLGLFGGSKVLGPDLGQLAWALVGLN